jgi:hypothetical protein
VKSGYLDQTLTIDERNELTVHLTDAVVIQCLAACRNIAEDMRCFQVPHELRREVAWCFSNLLGYLKDTKTEVVSPSVVSIQLGLLGEKIGVIKGKAAITPHRNSIRDRTLRATLKRLPLR